MKHLVVIGLVGFIACSKVTTKEDVVFVDDINSLVSYASCKGPAGMYKTTFRFDKDGNTEMYQDLIYRDEIFHARVVGGVGVTLDSDGEAQDTLSTQTNLIINSHSFHQIHINPTGFFSQSILKKKEAGVHYFIARDKIGNAAEYQTTNGVVSAFTMRNPMDTTEKIVVQYENFVDTKYGSLVNKVKIIQGGVDEYFFDFDSLVINESHVIKMQSYE